MSILRNANVAVLNLGVKSLSSRPLQLSEEMVPEFPFRDNTISLCSYKHDPILFHVCPWYRLVGAQGRGVYVGPQLVGGRVQYQVGGNHRVHPYGMLVQVVIVHLVLPVKYYALRLGPISPFL